jgi:hypothetical protein
MQVEKIEPTPYDNKAKMRSLSATGAVHYQCSTHDFQLNQLHSNTRESML